MSVEAQIALRLARLTWPLCDQLRMSVMDLVRHPAPSVVRAACDAVDTALDSRVQFAIYWEVGVELCND